MTRKIFFGLFWLVAQGTLAMSNVEHANQFLTELQKLSDNVKSKGDEAERKKMVKQLSASVDFEGLAKKSLGAHWTKTPPAKREEFLKVLEDLVEKVLYPRAKRIESKVGDVKFTTVPGKPQSVKASTKYEYEKAGDIVSRNVEIELLYKNVGGKPKIVDAILEGEQVSANLKRQFTQILEKHTIDEVMEKMRQKLKAGDAPLVPSSGEKAPGVSGAAKQSAETKAPQAAGQ
jgi:phospholipid transport system substrate-binding protein